jgi:CMP-N-acetylneuraminic acid synthetase
MFYTFSESAKMNDNQVAGFKPRVVAIITARSGSKRLPGKNLMHLDGRPLIAHTISSARECKLLTDVFVSTDDPAIKSASIQAGASVIDRPAELATDTATSADAVEHALLTLRTSGREYDVVVLLQPTSPFRTSTHLTESLEAFLKSSAQSSISVVKPHVHPSRCFQQIGEWLEPLMGANTMKTPISELPTAYQPNGAIYAVHVPTFLRLKTFYCPPSLPYVMSDLDSVDIDTRIDFALCESILVERAKTGAAKV